MKVIYLLLLLVVIVEIGAQRHERPQRHKYYKVQRGRQFNIDADYDPISELDTKDVDDDNDDDYNDDENDNDNNDNDDDDDNDFNDDLDDELNDDSDEDNIGGGFDGQADIDTDTDNSIVTAPNANTATTSFAPTATALSAPTAASGTTTAPDALAFRRVALTSPNFSSEDATSTTPRSISPELSRSSALPSPEPKARALHRSHHHHRGHHSRSFMAF